MTRTTEKANPPETDVALYEVPEHIVTISLNRPGASSAVDGVAARRPVKLCVEARNDPAKRVSVRQLPATLPTLERRGG